ncbi:unnamed protein product [Tuber aestivum]|uniref:Uncharacterized protein n=1 Tax=Tuber aestivum TaxID=59557 RepID=A0A292PJ95_9PEZI|nr:unnamed protein product [Tuber aestivum]
MELATGHSCQTQRASSGLAARATRRGSGRNDIDSECKNGRRGFRFGGSRMHSAEESHLQDVWKSKPFVRGIVKVPEGIDDLTMCGSGGNDMTCLGGERLPDGGDGGQDPCGHENPQTDYGATMMFDYDEAWSHEQDKQNNNMLGLGRGSDYVGGAGVPDLFGSAATPGSRPGPCPRGSNGRIALLDNMEGILGQSSEYALKHFDDEPCDYGDDTLSTFGKAPDPLEIDIGATSNDVTSTCEHPQSSYDPTVEQPSSSFAKEGFFSGGRIPPTSEHMASSTKCRHPEPGKNNNDGAIIVRCRAVDVVKNGKIRWIDVSGSASKVRKSTPAWPLYPDRGGNKEPIERPPFPAVVKERSPIHGLSADTTVKTCFHIRDAVEVATLVARGKFGGDVHVELFAKVLQNRAMGGGTRQRFQFCDILLVGPPFLPGEYVVPKAGRPWDTDLEVLTGAAMVRVIGHMDKRNSAGEWALKIEDIRGADWDDVDWARRVVCGNEKN